MDGRASGMWRFINQVLILGYQAEIHHVFKAYGNSGSMRIEVNKLLACSGRMLLSTSSRMKAHIFCLPAWRTWSKSVTCWLGSLFLLAMLSAPDSCSRMLIVHGKPGWKHTWVESKYCGRRKSILKKHHVVYLFFLAQWPFLLFWNYCGLCPRGFHVKVQGWIWEPTEIYMLLTLKGPRTHFHLLLLQVLLIGLSFYCVN